MVTKEEFDKISPGKIFLTGKLPNMVGGLFMGGKTLGGLLRWVAKKGYAGDWCIYCDKCNWSKKKIVSQGDRVTFENHIRMCVTCDDEVFNAYRY